MNLLLVEDDIIIGEGTADFLKEAGYKVFLAQSGEEGLKIFKEEQIHLLILDIMLPGMSGIDILKKVRKESSLPVIILTALNDEQTQIKIFDEYADDYLAKPFSLIILKKRIEAQLRNHYVSKSFWTYGKAKVDFNGFTASYNGKEVKLTTKEFKLLELLIENRGYSLTRGQILDKIWSFEEEPYERVIDVYVKNLRKKLGLDAIKTIKGVGYKLEV